MEYRILGPLEVVSGGRTLDLGGPKRGAVLAALVLAGGRVVSSDRLMDVLWGDQLPSSAPNALQVHVSRLREALEPEGPPYRMLRTEELGYRLDLDTATADAEVFEELVRRGRAALERGEPESAASLLSEALSLWRGRALGPLADHPHFRSEAERLEDLRLSALEGRIAAELDLGRHHELVGELAMLTRSHPLREGFWGQLMLALYRSGRQAEALRAFQAARRLLGEELGVEPSAGLSELEERILLQDPGLALPIGPRHNLPAPLSSFVGRKQELDTVLGWMGESRLVTLTGVGGSGKTRLALEAGWRLLDRHPEGIWWVELADLADPALVARRMLRLTGTVEQADRPVEEALAETLRRGTQLLVLDNCEHLLPDVAQLCGRLLAAAPRLRALATSRERLGIPGERILGVEPLSVPPTDQLRPEEAGAFESVELFCERASEIDSGFRLLPENASIVARICRWLEGIPLALELAAGLVGGRSLEEIADELEAVLDLPRSGRGVGPLRHRTLRGALTWSHRLLDPNERVTFRRLAVLQGGFDLAAAQAVCADDLLPPDRVPSAVLSLVGRSLVVADTRGRRARYRLLEPVRTYAMELLEEAEEVSVLRDRHLAFFGELARAGAEGLLGADQLEWKRRLETEHDNLRAALAWTREAREAEAGLRLAGSLAWFWWHGGALSEGRWWLESQLEGRGEASPEAVAGGLRGAGLLAVTQGDLEAGKRFLEEALTVDPGDPVGLALTRSFLGLARWAGGDLEAAEGLIGDALEAFRAAGFAWGTGAALNMLGRITRIRGEPERARVLHEEALETFRALGNLLGTAVALDWLASATAEMGDLDRAVELSRESLRLYQEAEFREGIASALNELGDLELRREREDQARRFFLRSLRVCRELGHRGGLARAMEGLARLESRSGDRARAIGLLAAVHSLRREAHLAAVGEDGGDRELDEARGALGEERVAELWSRAITRPVDEVVAEALSDAQP